MEQEKLELGVSVGTKREFSKRVGNIMVSALMSLFLVLLWENCEEVWHIRKKKLQGQASSSASSRARVEILEFDFVRPLANWDIRNTNVKLVTFFHALYLVLL